MRNDASDLRKSRIHHIEKLLLSQKKAGHNQVSLRKTLALIDYTLGLSRSKGKEYLNTLADLGHIELYGDTIKLNMVVNKK